MWLDVPSNCAKWLNVNSALYKYIGGYLDRKAVPRIAVQKRNAAFVLGGSVKSNKPAVTMVTDALCACPEAAAVARARKPRGISLTNDQVQETQDGGDRQIDKHSQKYCDD